MKNKEKPIYEEPKVFKLDEQEAVYGGGEDDCNGNGSSAGNACAANGNNAGNFCEAVGNGFV